jgi:hypothetical protein
MLFQRAISTSQALTMCSYAKCLTYIISYTVYNLQTIITLIKHLSQKKLGAFKLLREKWIVP